MGRKIDKRLAQKRAIRRGEENTQRAKEQQRQLCTICDQPVNVEEDLFDKGLWWHKQCWQESTSKEISP
jgi:hypothetical protein